MKQTPIHDALNPDLIALMPAGAKRVVEVGCSSGALAREYLKANPTCDYVGIEVDPDYAIVAKKWCARVISGSIEQLDEAMFASLFPSDCWVFGDVLEHLYDPWAVLRRVRALLAPGASVVACIPNAQHWSLQARLNSGRFCYEDAGLLDRTHIRWFTKATIKELFTSSGFRIVEGGARIFDEPERDRVLDGIRAFSRAIGTDADEAAENATPLQWVVRAMPA